MSELMAAERLPAPETGSDKAKVGGWILSCCLHDEELFLDVFHTLIQIGDQGPLKLDKILSPSVGRCGPPDGRGWNEESTRPLVTHTNKR
jgi:hypothetical protein